MNTVKYLDVFNVAKIDVTSTSGRSCLDLRIGRNEHPTGKFESAFLFLSFRL